MKKDVVVILVLSAIALILAVVVVIFVFGFGKGSEKQIKVSDFDEIYIETSPGRGSTTRYTIVCEGDTTRITITKSTSAPEDNRDVQKGTCSTDDMIELLNKYNVASWDGFDGKKDGGNSFDFEAVINGEELSADSRGGTPKNFDDFVRSVKKIMSEEDD